MAKAYKVLVDTADVACHVSAPLDTCLATPAQMEAVKGFLIMLVKMPYFQSLLACKCPLKLKCDRCSFAKTLFGTLTLIFLSASATCESLI